jgi:glyoxylase-like metal-dependent hydrolase (beta-lactamase superfamily II)
MQSAVPLPAGVQVFERGWLSSNNILMRGPAHAALVDSGYVAHAAQTLALVDAALMGQPLDTLLNTHLHSDHCGGNAVLQKQHPSLATWVPPGNAQAVSAWDEDALTFKATGQSCDRFTFTHTLVPGSTIGLGAQDWEVHAAPGHDPDAVMLFEPETKTLISADALWHNGFGVVFPELEGKHAFDAVADSIDLCETLAPRVVIPGHGAPFMDVNEAIARARSRLAYLRRGTPPINHSLYAAKVLLKFHLLEHQRVTLATACEWLCRMPYFTLIAPTLAPHIEETSAGELEATPQVIALWLAQQLCASGAARLDDTTQQLINQ